MGFGDWGGPAASILGGGASAAASIAEAKKQRRWTRKNQKHAVRWRVKDLRKAGINPILAANMGLGSGGGGGGATAQIPNLGSVGETINTAKRIPSEVKLRTRQASMSVSQRKLIDTQLLGERARIAQTNAGTQKLIADTILTIANIDIRKPWSDLGAGGSDMFTRHFRAAGKDSPSNAKEVMRLLQRLGLFRDFGREWQQ